MKIRCNRSLAILVLPGLWIPSNAANSGDKRVFLTECPNRKGLALGEAPTSDASSLPSRPRSLRAGTSSLKPLRGYLRLWR